MAIFTVGARLHDYGKGTPDELFGKVSADGFACVQLAYKKCVPGVASYADVTPQLVQNTLEAQKKHNIAVAVLGTYVELAIADEVQRSANAADFKSQLAVCKALNAGCIGTETTGMHKQPAGTTRECAQYMLCKSLETILPEAERLGVTVAIEPVVGDSTNTPQVISDIIFSEFGLRYAVKIEREPNAPFDFEAYDRRRAEQLQVYVAQAEQNRVPPPNRCLQEPLR